MNLIRRFVCWLCTKYGLRPVDEKEYDRLFNIMLERKVIDEKLDEYRTRIESVEFQTMEKYKIENEKLHRRNDLLEAKQRECEDYYLQIQSQLDSSLKTHSDFNDITKYEHNSFPGATAFSSSANNGLVKITGRTVFTDNIAAHIMSEPDIRMKYSLAINELTKYGIMDKITQHLVTNGAIQFTFAYNDKNTTLELYYMISCTLPDEIILIENDV